MLSAERKSRFWTILHNALADLGGANGDQITFFLSRYNFFGEEKFAICMVAALAEELAPASGKSVM